MPNWERRGTHHHYCEGDVVFMEIHGELTVDDMRWMFELCDATEKVYGYVLRIIVTDSTVSVGPEARQLAGDRVRVRPPYGTTAMVGASFAVRTIAFLLRNVARLASKQVSPLQFFASVEDAYKWVDKERQRLRSINPTQANSSNSNR